MTKSIHHKSDFEVLFRSHYKALVGYANRLVADVEVSEDLVQQVFVNLWERRDQIEIEGSGNVVYDGNPTSIQVNTSGSGSVRAR